VYAQPFLRLGYEYQLELFKDKLAFPEILASYRVVISPSM